MTARWVASSYAQLSWRDGYVELSLTLSGTTFTSDDLELVHLVHAFARPRTIDDIVREFTPPVPQRLAARIDDLIRAGVLVPADDREDAAAHYWDPAALAYHRRSRRPDFHKLAVQTTPAVAPSRSDSIPLARGVTTVGHDLMDVLDGRRSTRAWPAVTIPFHTFSQWLWACARNRGSSEGDAGGQVSRVYPSGGGAYSLELYPVLACDAVESIATGVYRYQPERHGLEPISTSDSEVLLFLEAAGRSVGAAKTPPIVVLVTSRFARQSEIYTSLAYSLVLKEVGCLFQTMYLVATYLDLGACALGGGTPFGRLARLCGTSELAEPVVGEFLLGPG